MRKLKANEILVLRSCGVGGASERNFVWPLTVGAVVEAPDWQDTDACGHGLHGLPWAQGGDYCDNSAPVWLVLRVSTVKGNYRHGTGNMTDKCKFGACTVEGVFDNSKDATDMILAHAPAGTVANYCMLKGGDYSTLTGGDCSTLTGGGYSTLTGGDCSTLTGGDRSTLTGGYRSTLTGGYHSTLTGGYGSTLTGGNDSTLTGGDGSTLTGGGCSTLCWRVWDGSHYRLHVRYTGEDGIEAGKAYRYENGQIVEVTR